VDATGHDHPGTVHADITAGGPCGRAA